MSAKNLPTATTTDNSLSPSIKWDRDSNFCFLFNRSCLKEENATFSPPNRVNFFIAYKLDTWLRDLNSDFTLKICLFGDVELV